MLSNGIVRLAPPISSNRSLSARPPCARYLLRGAEEVMALASRAIGFSLPLQPCTSVVHEKRAALWLGPQEQLLLAAESEAAELGATLRQALLGMPHALLDIGHRQTAFHLSGPRAEALLNAGCPLDLDRDVFRVGSCTRTVFGKAEIVLWRRAEETFHIEVWRSFAAYVTELLGAASNDVGP